MADYYPLIARAIAGLDPNAPGESRRALYERARTALIAQLRSVQPPLSESEITRERLSLEEAVRKVESEAAQRAREASRPGGGSGAAARRRRFPPRQCPAAGIRRPSGRAARRAAPSVRLLNPPRARRVRRLARMNSVRRAICAPMRRRPARRARSRRRFRCRMPACRRHRRPASAAAAPPPRPRKRPPAAMPPQPPGMRGFRDIAADADDLGRAAAQANRAARKTYANVPSPSPEFDRLEPSMENRGADPDAPYSYDESLEEADRYAPQPPPPQPPSRERSRLSQDRDREPKKQRARTGAVFPFKSAIAVGIVLILVGAGILWGRSAVTAVGGLFKSSPVVEAPKDPNAPQSRPKIPDRVGQPSSSENVAPVAQRVVLYDEDPSDPKGKQYVGSVIWRTEPIKASGNQKPDIAVRADIEIPDRKFKMTMSFRRNTDSSLPASHTAELTFILPQDFSGGGVGNVPGILMKSNEQARGTPLAGLAVKVTDGFFLVGLSNVNSDRARNLQLLKERSWFDVPLVYVNQRRAIIAIEKGAPGERAFNDAFALWGE